jgi:hypothetical protein
MICEYFSKLKRDGIAPEFCKDYGHCSIRSGGKYLLIRPKSHCEKYEKCGIYQCFKNAEDKGVRK